jgi:class 3 adenylate cyclase
MLGSNMTISVYASVVFLKMQDFARRPVTEQARLRAQLEAVVAVTACELAERDRIVLEASDGAAVVVLHDPRGALRLAERALSAGAAGLALSVGINHGAVQLAGDGHGGDGMVGDGIAVAANAAAFASPQQILMSRAFREALADSEPGAEAALVPMGTFTDAGLRTHELFRREAGAARRRARRYAALSAAAFIGLIGAGVAMRVSAVGQEAFVEDMVSRYHQTTAKGQRYFKGLVERVKF